MSVGSQIKQGPALSKVESYIEKSTLPRSPFGFDGRRVQPAVHTQEIVDPPGLLISECRKYMTADKPTSATSLCTRGIM